MKTKVKLEQVPEHDEQIPNTEVRLRNWKRSSITSSGKYKFETLSKLKCSFHIYIYTRVFTALQCKVEEFYFVAETR